MNPVRQGVGCSRAGAPTRLSARRIGAVLILVSLGATSCAVRAWPTAPTPPARSAAATAPALPTAPSSGPPSQVTVQGIEVHLHALQAIADRFGGTRADGTPGYAASVRYVKDVLEAAGYHVQALPVSIPRSSRTSASANRRVVSLIAETPFGDHGHVIMLGAHLDSVAKGPGINDNGSGAATVLEIARWLMGQRSTSAIRFGFWAGEEIGLLGSKDYVDHLSAKERAAIRVYLNLDMVGSPNFIRGVYASDQVGSAVSRRVERLFLAHFRRAGLAAETIVLPGSSDHLPFREAGIPTGGLFAGLRDKTVDQERGYGGRSGRPADPCYHRACDRVGGISDVVLGQLTDAVVDVLGSLTQSD